MNIVNKMNKILSKLKIIILNIIFWMIFLFMLSYCTDLAKYFLPPYNYFTFPLTVLFTVPSSILIFYLLLYAHSYIKYVIGFLFNNYVYVNLFALFHRSTKSFKLHKSIGIEDHYWDRVVKKENNK